jgi:predicted DNA-binding protein
MKNEYSCRIYLDSQTEQAIKYMSFKTGKSIAQIAREALAAYTPLTEAYEEFQSFSKR